MPRDTYDVYVQFGGGWDEYFADDSVPVERPGELFGLQSADSTSWNFGSTSTRTTCSPRANYGTHLQLVPGVAQREPAARSDLDRPEPELDAGQRRRHQYVQPVSRSAACRPQHGHPLRLRPESDSNNAFVHGGPRIDSLAAANQFIPLPDVDNTWQRASVDVQHFLNNRVGIGVGWASRISTSSTSIRSTRTGPSALPTKPATAARLAGRADDGVWQPAYTGNTFQARVIYKF